MERVIGMNVVISLMSLRFISTFFLRIICIESFRKLRLILCSKRSICKNKRMSLNRSTLRMNIIGLNIGQLQCLMESD